MRVEKKYKAFAYRINSHFKQQCGAKRICCSIRPVNDTSPENPPETCKKPAIAGFLAGFWMLHHQ